MNASQISKECNACRIISDRCKTCRICKIVRYCSDACQESARPNHNDWCELIKEKMNANRKAEKKLRRCSESPWRISNGYMGHYWGIIECRPWCRSKAWLGFQIVDAGHAEKNLFAYEVALDEHFLELLRLNHSDNQGLRFMTSFLLIATHRYQKCFDLIAWFTLIGSQSDYDWGEVPIISRGEWKYLNDMDILRELPLQDLEADFVLALILLKLNIIHDLNNGKTYPSLNEKIQEIEGRNLSQDQTREEISQLKNAEIGRQREILNRLMTEMDHVNPRVLRAFVNPEPMEDIPDPEAYSRGSLSQAKIMMKYRPFFEQFEQIETLARRFEGQSLDYDVTPDRY